MTAIERAAYCAELHEAPDLMLADALEQAGPRADEERCLLIRDEMNRRVVILMRSRIFRHE